MAKSKRKANSARNTKKDILATITPDDALAILKSLAKEDKNIKKRIEQLAIEYLEGVDVEEIADAVYFDLDLIEVEELWDRSGSTRDGYVDVNEEAWVMFEEALEPYTDEIKRYHDRSMAAQVKLYCMGILKGIYLFEKESTSQYKDWAVDAPKDFFSRISRDWKGVCKFREDLDEMDHFIEQECPEWV
jgi:hypothetical protein